MLLLSRVDFVGFKRKFCFVLISIGIGLSTFSCKTPLQSSGSKAQGFFPWSSSYTTSDGAEDFCPPTRKIFYHWGNPSRLSEWLQAIGSDASGSPRPLSEAMMSSLLAGSDKEAVLGAGFYLADSPIATIQYGRQLLLVRITKGGGDQPPCERLLREKLPEFIASHGKQKENLAGQLPVLVAFGEIRPYYLLRRFPAKKEDLTVTVGLPQESDIIPSVGEYFQSLPTQGLVTPGKIKDIHDVIKAVTHLADAKRPLTPEAWRFISTFVYDHVVATYLSGVSSSPPKGQTLEQLGILCRLSKAGGMHGASVQALMAVPNIACEVK